MQNNIYVDNSATTRLDDCVLRKMIPYLTDQYGNASSSYELGRMSQKAIVRAREDMAKMLNIDSEEIYFTSSGSESDNMAIRGVARKYACRGKHIITSNIEHLAVLNTCKDLEEEGYEVTYLSVEKNGIISIDKLKEAIREDTILISIMSVNNEIGTVQPIDEIAKIARDNNIFFHTDAVQGVPHFKIDASKCDMLSISAHKFNGPKGVGMLYIKKGIDIYPLIFGGHQEKCLRAGTENVAGIVGMSEALKITQENLCRNNMQEKCMRDYLLNRIVTEIKGVYINGCMENRIPGNINISFDGVDTSDLMVFLDMEHICSSSGSACNSSVKELSHVLRAIGQDKTSLRMTLSSQNTFYEMDKICKVLCESVNKIRSKECRDNYYF